LWYDLVQGIAGTLTNIASPGTASSGWNVGVSGGVFTPPAAVSLAGTNQFVDAGQVSGVTDGASAFTVMVTMRSTTATGICGLGKGSANGTRWELLKFSDSNVYYLITNGGNAWGTAVSADADWHTYALVFNGAGSGNTGRLQGYKDGIPQTLSFTGTIPATTASVAASLGIGRGPGDSPQFSVGHIAAVWIYTIAAPAAFVQLHATETRLNYPTLLHHLPGLWYSLLPSSGGGPLVPESALTRSSLRAGRLVA
jgi:hypothetical protein